MTMRSFHEFEAAHEMRLVQRGRIVGRFSTRKSGTGQHFDLGGRIFSGPGAARRAEAFGDIYGACRSWLALRPGLAGWVQVRPVLEVGADFVAWEFKPTGASLHSYSNLEQYAPDDLVPEVPPAVPLFVQVIEFFLSDDPQLMADDPAREIEEEDARAFDGGYGAAMERLAIVRGLLRESLDPETSSATPLNWRFDQWEIHPLPITLDVADRWAELSGY